MTGIFNISNIPNCRNPVALVDTSGVLSGATILAIGVGSRHTLVLTSTNTLIGWGSNVSILLIANVLEIWRAPWRSRKYNDSSID
jgi:alpha-tubulin suppressor-like RCC1 family protein